MKKTILLIYLLMAGVLLSAQTNPDNDQQTVNNADDTGFNRWSVEFSMGFNRPISPFTDGYYSVDPSKALDFGTFGHFRLGTRYMLSRSFGLSAGFTYDKFKNPSGSSSLEFDTRRYMFQLEGVTNMGYLLDFHAFAPWLGLLAHGGFQLSRFESLKGIYDGRTEKDGGFLLGLTPQFKIGNHFAITTDVTYVLNIRQHMNWDGNGNNTNYNLKGDMITLSVGLTFYLGKHKKHADWAEADHYNYVDNSRFETLAAAVANVQQKQLADEKQTEAVKNEAAQNNQAVNSLDARVTVLENNKPNGSMAGNGTQNGYNVFFNLNSARVKNEYLPVIASAAQQLQNNPALTVTIYGYTDVTGGEKLNKRLSEKRAKAVAKLLEHAGIDAKRIKTKGMGVDNKFKTKTPEARILNRRVTISFD